MRERQEESKAVVGKVGWVEKDVWEKGGRSFRSTGLGTERGREED